ncbi:MAG: hypothetical protein LBL13_10645 [Bacteroidales bacterium]|jgi:competence protein ComGC|nr:hypothetical protein [Bacteroidales bacterium]
MESELNNNQNWVKKNPKKRYGFIIFCVIVVGFLLSFHILPEHLLIFTKENLTFSNTIVMQKDIDKLIERSNNAFTIFEQQAIMQEPLFKKLMEKGIIYQKDEKKADKEKQDPYSSEYSWNEEQESYSNEYNWDEEQDSYSSEYNWNWE